MDLPHSVSARASSVLALSRILLHLMICGFRSIFGEMPEREGSQRLEGEERGQGEIHVFH